MDQRMNEYFAAAEPQKLAILDSHLDEMQARVKEFQQRRAQRPQGESNRAAPAQPGGSAAPAVSGRPGGPDRHGPGNSHGQPSRERRKAHSESRNPDSSARRNAYFAALNARAEQRGIQMPWGGPGHGH